MGFIHERDSIFITSKNTQTLVLFGIVLHPYRKDGGWPCHYSLNILRQVFILFGEDEDGGTSENSSWFVPLTFLLRVYLMMVSRKYE